MSDVSASTHFSGRVELITLFAGRSGVETGVSVQERKITLQPELHGTDLPDNRIGVVSRAPKPALRALKAKKFAVKRIEASD
ncbi:hypothetical protein AB4Z52_32415 [Rhizobium sp. 2YAF20]|uniref:hypothetical protein n=1 Tax=Rhizobium sp. 2YAF20 TaxID=3233027 RepID=UPI003F9833D4